MKASEPSNIIPFRKPKKEKTTRHELSPVQQLLLNRLLKKFNNGEIPR